MKAILLLILLMGCVSPSPAVVTVALDGYATATRDLNEHYPDYAALYFKIEHVDPDTNLPFLKQHCAMICYSGVDWNGYSLMKEKMLQFGEDRNTVSFTLKVAPPTCGPYWGQICEYEIKTVEGK